MPSEVRGVVATAKGAPVEVTTIVVPDPGPGEALVRVQACGVCHTDLHYREGGIGDDFPYLLGHEAAGIGCSIRPKAIRSICHGASVTGRGRSAPSIPRRGRRSAASRSPRSSRRTAWRSAAGPARAAATAGTPAAWAGR